MPGKAIIILLIGMIVLTGLVISGITKTSSNISKNMVADYQKKMAYNISQSGANIGLGKWQQNPWYRHSGFDVVDMLNGKVNIRVIDTLVDSSSVVVVKSTGYTNYGNDNQVSFTSSVFCPKMILPPASVKAAYCSASNVPANGNGEIDGRNHLINDQLVSPGGTGTYGVWSTNTINSFGSCTVGGTSNGIDYAPSHPLNPSVVAENQTYPGGFPTSPDQLFGGDSAGFIQGTLLTMSQSGKNGSQYIKSVAGSLPSYYNYFTGVTYLDLSAGVYQFDLTGSGILIINNQDIKPLTLKNPGGLFKGIVILSGNSNIEHMHGEIIGALITCGPKTAGNVNMNGEAKIHYSTQAIDHSMRYFTTSKFIWYEN